MASISYDQSKKKEAPNNVVEKIYRNIDLFYAIIFIIKVFYKLNANCIPYENNTFI